MARFSSAYDTVRTVTVDRKEWDALYTSLIGARPGQGSEATVLRVLDPAVHSAAKETRKMVAEDTPVDTGLLKSSWTDAKLKDSDHLVANMVYYAPIVESRPPGGPQKYRGAMIAQNLARIEATLIREIVKRLTALISRKATSARGIAP